LKKYCLDLIATDLDTFLSSEEYQQHKAVLDKILGTWVEKERQRKIQQKEEEKLFTEEEPQTEPQMPFRISEQLFRKDFSLLHTH
jgi:hypothetical protein